MANVHYVNNTGIDIRKFMPIFQKVYRNESDLDDLVLLFKITMLDGFNADSSARMVIDLKNGVMPEIPAPVDENISAF